MKIVVDAMGGDLAPSEIVRGAVAAVKRNGVQVVLVGREAEIQPYLAKAGLRDSQLSVVNAAQVVGFHEPPVRAIQDNPDSSIAVGMRLVKEGYASAFVSAGNTGAVMYAALATLGRMEGVQRPALGFLFPSPKPGVLLLDVGANVDCRPNFLVQFGKMGSVYMERVMGLERPRVGLLSSGEEETKGNQLVRAAHKLLKATDLNFVGNVEGRDIFSGVADVIVTDGFTGNVVLKASEGFGETLLKWLEQFQANHHYLRSAGLLVRPALRAFARKVDYSEYGGAPLLGVDGNVIIAHGRSRAKAIRNAVRIAKQAEDQGVLEALKRAGGKHG